MNSVKNISRRSLWYALALLFCVCGLSKEYELVENVSMDGSKLIFASDEENGVHPPYILITNNRIEGKKELIDFATGRQLAEFPSPMKIYPSNYGKIYCTVQPSKNSDHNGTRFLSIHDDNEVIYTFVKPLFEDENDRIKIGTPIFVDEVNRNVVLFDTKNSISRYDFQGNMIHTTQLAAGDVYSVISISVSKEGVIFLHFPEQVVCYGTRGDHLWTYDGDCSWDVYYDSRSNDSYLRDKIRKLTIRIGNTGAIKGQYKGFWPRMGDDLRVNYPNVINKFLILNLEDETDEREVKFPDQINFSGFPHYTSSQNGEYIGYFGMSTSSSLKGNSIVCVVDRNNNLIGVCNFNNLKDVFVLESLSFQVSNDAGKILLAVKDRSKSKIHVFRFSLK